MDPNGCNLLPLVMCEGPAISAPVESPAAQMALDRLCQPRAVRAASGGHAITSKRDT
jgi:hypothetical protein